MSEITSVEQMDKSKKNSPISQPATDEATVLLDKAENKCFWNGRAFDDGQQVDCQGEIYECNYGQWVKM